MKLLRFGQVGAEKPGALDSAGVVRDLSAHISDIGYDQLDDSSLNKLRQIDLSTCPEVDASTRLGQPVSNIRKVVCIGLNYSDHAEESGMDIPAEPILFMKADTSLLWERPPGMFRLRTHWIMLPVIVSSMTFQSG